MISGIRHGYHCAIVQCMYRDTKSSIARPPLLRPLLDVLQAWSSRVVRGSQVALVEGTDLILLECTDDSMENTAVVEENEILLFPVFRY